MRFGLKFKISFLVTLIILVIMSAIAYLFGLRQEQTMRSEMRLRAAGIAQITGSLSLIELPGTEAAGWDLIRKFVDIAPQLDPNILYIVVVDRKGAVPASSINAPLLRNLTGREEVSELSQKLTEEIRQGLINSRRINPGEAGFSRPWLDLVGHLLPAEVELMPRGEFLGMVGIGFSLRNMDQQIIRARLIGGGITLLFILVGIGASVLLATSITRPVYTLVQGMERVQAGDLTAEVKNTSRDEIGMLSRSFNFMTAGLRERERVKKTFKRYVSRDVAEKILSSPDEVVLTGERRMVSVLFADIRRFTSFSEKMEPEEVVAILNEHFTLMIDAIFRHKGTLDKFMGDAIMAVFGAPISYGDDAYRAVQAAVEMQQALRQLNEKGNRSGRPPIDMGIGITTGNVVSGNIGSEQRTEFTVIGDTVNTAARIQGKTSGGQILISERTYQDVKDRIKTRPREPFHVKGKSEAVVVYEVVYT